MKKITLLLICIAIATVSCKQYTEITGADLEKIKIIAEPIAENILTAHNEDDYQKYSKDFDEKMKLHLPKKVYGQNREIIMSKIGKYQSKSFDKALKKDQYIVIHYKAVFEKENNVSVKVVLQKVGDKHLVSGLWFNSKNLRK